MFPSKERLLCIADTRKEKREGGAGGEWRHGEVVRKEERERGEGVIGVREKKREGEDGEGGEGDLLEGSGEKEGRRKGEGVSVA